MTKNRYHDWYKLYDKLSVEINPDPEELKQLFNQESQSIQSTLVDCS